MNLLNPEQRDWQANLSTKNKKIANELAETVQPMSISERKKIKNESADDIRQDRLANQHQHQNQKNAYSATITDEIRNFHATVQSTFALY